MPSNLLSSFVKIINRIVDVVSQGNFERVRVLREFNYVFKQAYLAGETDKFCKVTTAAGKPANRHELSTFYLRSGFKITIHNDNDLKGRELKEVSLYVLESMSFIRQIMALGYDTLIVEGRTTRQRMEISLKEVADLRHYMLKN